MGLWDAIKKKGFKANILKIPTRRTPIQIEHKIRTEFDRARTINTLKMIEVFLTDPDKTVGKRESVLMLVSGLRSDLEAYKE